MEGLEGWGRSGGRGKVEKWGKSIEGTQRVRFGKCLLRIQGDGKNNRLPKAFGS